MAEVYRPKPRQSGNLRSEQPVFRIDKAKVINKVKSNRGKETTGQCDCDCDCACSV